MGASSDTAESKFKWNDAFWTDIYNSAALNMTNITGESDGKKLVSSDESESEEEKPKRKQKNKHSTENSESSEFDGEIVI